MTGQPLHSLLRERMHQPLALTGTWMEGEEEGSFAPVRGYLSGIDVTPQVDPSWTWASGGLVGPALDVSRWMEALVLGDVLPEGAREDQQTPVAPAGEQAPYGLGLYIVDRGHGRLLGHTGSTMGFQSDCFVHPDTGWVVTVLENDFGAEASDVADALWDVLLD